MTLVARFGQVYTEDVDVACLSSDSVGDLVCIRDIPIGNKWRVQKADPGERSKMPAIGVLVSKSTPTVGVVKLWGPVAGIFSGLVVGKTYSVDYTGLRIGPPDIGVSGYSLCQFVGIAVDTTVLFLNPDLTMIKHR